MRWPRRCQTTSKVGSCRPFWGPAADSTRATSHATARALHPHATLLYFGVVLACW